MHVLLVSIFVFEYLLNAILLSNLIFSACQPIPHSIPVGPLLAETLGEFMFILVSEHLLDYGTDPLLK